jgi:hypothetical protein
MGVMNEVASQLKRGALPYNKRIEPTAGGRHAACLRKRPAGSPPRAGLPASPSGPSSRLIRALGLNGCGARIRHEGKMAGVVDCLDRYPYSASRFGRFSKIRTRPGGSCYGRGFSHLPAQRARAATVENKNTDIAAHSTRHNPKKGCIT